MTHPVTDTGAGRAFNTSTNIGKMMVRRLVTATEVSKHCDIPPRTLTELLAGRRTLNPSQLIALCDYLHCEPDQLEG